jgi:hypothetical protein
MLVCHTHIGIREKCSTFVWEFFTGEVAGVEVFWATAVGPRFFVFEKNSVIFF